MRVAGSRPQGPVGQVSRRGGWGPFLKLRFFANLLVGAWRRRGCRLKRLLRRWGPGGKRSRDTPPTPPPPSPPPAFWGCKGERKRVFTLSAFAVGQVSRGLGARAPRAWGPAHQGPGAFSPQKPPKPLKLRFFRKPPGGSLAKAWVSAETAASEVGTWRETKPGYPRYPPPPPTPPPAFWGCKGERKRVFTLSAFGNHPTRPPRSADYTP